MRDRLVIVLRKMEQYVWSQANRYLTTNDDDFTTSKQTEQLKNVLYINMVIFAILVTLFEMLRHIKAIFLNRYCGKFLKLGRVPPKPGFLPFSWIWTIMHISEDEVLRMVGLDGYMLLRYLTVCFRTACFFAFFGSVILAPVYWSGDHGLEGWGRFTLANIPDGPTNYLWVPVIFAYVFTMFFCQLMYLEYVNFKEKRVQYIVTGDADTPGQTYYTVMIERLPTSLRSTSALEAFFDKLFPGQIFNVEVAVDLNDLEDLVHNRRLVRNKLEKAIAIFKATKQRPKQWVKASMYKNEVGRPIPVEDSWIASVLGYEVHDAIDHFEHLLDLFNNNVAQLQRAYYDQRQKLDDDERSRLQILRDKLRKNEQLAGVVNTIGTIGKTGQQIIVSGSSKLRDVAATSLRVPAPTKTDSPRRVEDAKDGDDAELSMSRKRDSSYGSSNNLNPLHTGAKFVGTGVEGIAREGIETAKVATKGAWKGVRAATRALELLTVGAYYTISSTGFVTFTNRVAKCSAEQMLLSHEFFNLDVRPAPNPRDLLWDNVSIPSQQIEMRKTIAGVMFGVGAIFWSLVVAFISAISNLESIAQVIPSLQKYSDTDAYQLLNNYLAIGLLLLLLALLPFVFDFVSRSYEGLKQESEIQNSIMARYFYYSLANVFVAVGLGSIASSLHQIIEDPASILTILGSSVPSFSTYFASLLIIRTCTAVPIEMLRLIPLLDILGVQLCYDKKKCTRRELRAGAFADPPMLYGWIYPNIIMVLMILFTYCCVSWNGMHAYHAAGPYYHLSFCRSHRSSRL